MELVPGRHQRDRNQERGRRHGDVWPGGCGIQVPQPGRGGLAPESFCRGQVMASQNMVYEMEDVPTNSA